MCQEHLVRKIFKPAILSRSFEGLTSITQQFQVDKGQTYSGLSEMKLDLRIGLLVLLRAVPPKFRTKARIS